MCQEKPLPQEGFSYKANLCCVPSFPELGFCNIGVDDVQQPLEFLGRAFSLSETLVVCSYFECS
jgi:hypothetical protein